jgi:hypothetical protein
MVGSSVSLIVTVKELENVFSGIRSSISNSSSSSIWKVEPEAGTRSLCNTTTSTVICSGRRSQRDYFTTNTSGISRNDIGRA